MSQAEVFKCQIYQGFPQKEANTKTNVFFCAIFWHMAIWHCVYMQPCTMYKHTNFGQILGFYILRKIIICINFSDSFQEVIFANIFEQFIILNFIILQIKKKHFGTEHRKIKQKSQNHSIFIFLCLLSPLFVWYSPSPAPLVLISKGNIQHKPRSGQCKCGRRSWDTP